MPNSKKDVTEGQGPIKMQVVVQHKRGLHLRSATQLAAIAAKYDARITISKGRKAVQANSPLEIVTLSASPGTKLLVTITGKEAQPASVAVLNFFNKPEDF